MRPGPLDPHHTGRLTTFLAGGARPRPQLDRGPGRLPLLGE